MNKYNTGYSTKRTTHVKMPQNTQTGSIDSRYTRSQFCKADGTRDMRTKNLKVIIYIFLY